MSKPMTRAELDAMRHGTLMDCGCQVCRLLATIEVLAAECRARRAQHFYKIDTNHEQARAAVLAMVAELNRAMAATDAAGILPPTSTPPR